MRMRKVNLKKKTQSSDMNFIDHLCSAGINLFKLKEVLSDKSLILSSENL